MATKPKAPAALCVLSIGYTRVLLPAETGLKVAGLLRGAVEVKSSYDDHQVFWELEDELEIEYQTTKAASVRSKRVAGKPTPPAPLFIEHEPLKLPHA